MSYEQRAREYLDRFTEEPTWDVYSPDAQAALEAIFESIAAEARETAIEDAAETVRCGCPEGVTCWSCDKRAKIRALVPRPDLRLVAREDLAHLLGTCGCDRVQHIGSVTSSWPADHIEAIDRLRAGEEG